MSKSKTNGKAAAKAAPKAQKLAKAAGKGDVAPKAVKAPSKPQNATGKPSEAYRQGGSYWGVTNSLLNLGAGRFHDASKMIAEYKKLVGAEAWKAFVNKAARNKETHKSAEDRVIVNALVVERKDYGKPLRATGMEVRHECSDKGYRFGIFKIGSK